MTKNYLGIDIGGTKIFVGRFNDNFEIEAEITTPTQADQGSERVIENLIHTINELKNECTISAGISWAGFVDAERGLVIKAPNLPGFENCPLTHTLEAHFPFPFFLENDARLFALAEQKSDPTDPKVLLGIIVGTGVGSGIVIHGHIFHGANNFGGEIGHAFLFPDQKIEAEELFAGPALTRFIQEKLGLESTLEAEEKLNNSFEQWAPKFDTYLTPMAVWIYNLILTLNPTKIVFGGGVGQNFLPIFTDILESKVHELLSERDYPTPCTIECTQLKNAGALGAAFLAAEKV